MVDKVLVAIGNIILITDVFLFLGTLMLFFREETLINKIQGYVKRYNKKMEDFQWYYTGEESEGLVGVVELSNTYCELQKKLSILEELYKRVFKRFYKVIKKEKYYENMIGKINDFRDIESEIPQKGLFLKLKQKKKLNHVNSIIMDNRTINARKNIVLDIPEIDLRFMIIGGIFIATIVFAIGYLVQFMWLDGLYGEIMKSTLFKLIKYLVLIVPSIIVLLYTLYQRELWAFFSAIFVWLKWSVLFIPCCFLLLVIIYSLKDIGYAFLITKRIIRSALFIGIILFHLFYNLFRDLSERDKYLETILFREKQECKEVAGEEYQDRLYEELEKLNKYIDIIRVNLKETNNLNQPIENMSIPDKLSYIINNSDYKVSAKKLTDDKKKAIVDAIYDYQCCYSMLCKPFIVCGRVDIKRINDNLEKIKPIDEGR